jgi:hypothetical protein
MLGLFGSKPFKTLSPAEVRDLVDSGEATFLDVRRATAAGRARRGWRNIAACGIGLGRCRLSTGSMP